jgi:Tfp pilus assembly protein PilV
MAHFTQPQNGQPQRESPRAVRRSPSGGFTLLEVVLSLMLSMLLVAAVLSAVKLYGRVSTTGRSEVTRSQLARGILRRMGNDLRATRFSGPQESPQSLDAVTQGFSIDIAGSEMTTVTAESAADTNAGRSMGIVGDATTLMIHMSRPPRPIDAYRPTGAVTSGNTNSDLQAVIYFMAMPDAEGLPGAVAAALLPESSNPNGTPLGGLARVVGDPVVLEALDAAGDVQSMAAGAQLLASEVEAIQFRYFDGSTWLDTWDSLASEKLPNAVEITLTVTARSGLSSASSSRPPFAGRSTTRMSSTSDDLGTEGEMVARTYRLVVSLQAADPVSPTDSLLEF